MVIPFSLLADLYENKMNFWFYHYIADALCKLIKDFSFKSILELGAGTGISTQVLKRYFPKAKILATDPCIEMLRLAKNKNLNNVDYLVLKAEDAISLKEKYELIFGNFCYHWFKNGTAIRLKKCLKKDGVLAFSIPINCADGLLGNKLLLNVYRNLKKHYHFSHKPSLRFKEILKEFKDFKLSYHFLSFSESYPANEWFKILYSRGSWHYLFKEYIKEAKHFWLKYENKEEIPLRWHILLLIGINNGKS